ncbi:heme transporter hrg1-A-like [Glandiceps talaboti]
MAPSKGAMWCRMTLTIVGIAVGVLAFFVFGIVLKSYHAAAWALISGIFACLALFLHVQHYKDWWRRCYRTLTFCEFIGLIVMLGCIPTFGVYLSFAIVQQQPVFPVESPNGYYVTCVWIFMTWKWSLQMFLFARSYRKLYDDDYLLPPFTD